MKRDLFTLPLGLRDELIIDNFAGGGEPSTVEAMRTCWYDITKTPDPEDAQCIATAVEFT